MIKELKFDLQSEVQDIRRNAVLSLIRSEEIDMKERLYLLRDLAVNDENPEIRSVARKYYNLYLEVARARGEAEKKPVISAENIDKILEKGEAQEKVASLMLVLDGKASIELEKLFFLLDSENDVFVIATLLSCIGRKGEDCSERIISFLNHKDSRVRANAVEALGRLNSEKDRKHIISMLSDKDPRVKANAAQALRRTGLSQTLDCLSEMLSSGARPQVESAVYALSRIKGEDAEQLLERGRKILLKMEDELLPDLTEKEKKEPDIFEAVSQGNVKLLKDIISKGINVDTRSIQGMTPLMEATLTRNTSIMQVLIRNGANIDARIKTSESYSTTLLGLAAKCSDIETIQLLVRYGADLDALDSEAKTALEQCHEHGNIELVHLLMDMGADIFDLIIPPRSKSRNNKTRKKIKPGTAFCETCGKKLGIFRPRLKSNHIPQMTVCFRCAMNNKVVINCISCGCETLAAWDTSESDITPMCMECQKLETGKN